MSRQTTAGRQDGHDTGGFSRSNFVANLGINSVLVPLFWIAALIALIKSLYVENHFGLVVAVILAGTNTLVAFHSRQSVVRSAVIYLGSIVFLIYDRRPDNVVSFCFLAVSLSFLVNDRKMMQRHPYSALVLILGYAGTLLGVAFWSSKETDTSVLFPELGCLLVVVLIFKSLLLPRPGHHPLPELRLEDFGLTEREVQILHLTWGGLHSKEIAAELSVSSGTIRTHLARINQKLNLQSTKELLLLPHTHNIIYGQRGADNETRKESRRRPETDP